MKIKVTLTERVLLWDIFCTYLFIFGLFSNTLVIKSNNDKMPFLSDYKYEDNEHFSFQIENKPKFWIFSDIIPAGDYIFSIGDILMFQGILTIPFLLSLYLYLKIKKSKRKKIK